jgi:hypothetical protein
MNDNFPELWGKSISIIFDQFAKLVNLNGFDLLIENPNELDSKRLNEFGESFGKHGSDKTTHGYHRVYSWISDQTELKNILEIGLGTNNPQLISSMGSSGHPGASLRAFKSLLPNALIYGADVDRDILFEEASIKTFFVDQLEISSFENLPNIKYDLIIDDGLHQIGSNFNTLLWALEHLNTNGFIVIEDIIPIEPWITISYILNLNPAFNCKLFKCKDSHVFLVRKI